MHYTINQTIFNLATEDHQSAQTLIKHDQEVSNLENNTLDIVFFYKTKVGRGAWLASNLDLFYDSHRESIFFDG
jgi:hypothetical protein